jgi:hypothetical protein
MTAPDEVARKQVVTNLRLSDDEIRVADQAREFLGRSAEEGAFADFAVDPDMFLTGYLPRIRQFLQDGANRKWVTGLRDGEVHKLLNGVYIGNVPKELDAFFKHQRVSAVADLALEKDPLALLLKYNAVGHRQQILGPIWDRIGKELDAARKAGTIDGELLSRFNYYREDLMGIPYGWGERTIRKVTEGIHQKFGVTPSLSTDILQSMRSWIYMTGMGFRPWVPIRNSFQPWTTLAPRLGNTPVAEAMQFVAGPKGGNYVNGLRSRGIIKTTLPVMGGEGIDPSGWFGQLTHKSMKAFKNSDEWTRAVAFRASEISFNDAMDSWKRGAIKTRDEFFDISGMWGLPTDLKNKAIEFIGKGDPKAARELFGTYMADVTMFPYRAGHSPMMYRGALGKMFGQFGTYPMYYRENVFQALRYGNTKQRLLFAARWTANMGAIWYGFQQIGVNADEFLFWQPMMFSGGPMWEALTTGIQMMSPSYKGRQSRANFLGLSTKDGKLSWDPRKSYAGMYATPYQITSIQKGIESLNRGDPWYTALLNFGSFPVFPPD